MGPAPPPVGGHPENQKRGAQTVKDREKERNRNEASTTYATPNATRRGNPENQNHGTQTVINGGEEECDRNETSTVDATDNPMANGNATTGATRSRIPAATTSTAPGPSLGYIFSDAPGPLPSVYGTILSGRN